MALLLSVWLLLAGLATTFTLGWLYAERRIFVTSLLAAGFWSSAALSARELEIVTETGSRVAVDTAGVQWLLAALGLLSFIVTVAYVFGFYPPEADGIERQEPGSAGPSARAPGDD